MSINAPGHGKAHLTKSLHLWDIQKHFSLDLLIFQRIEGLQISKSLSMFGQSISGQIDADNNGYVGEYRIYSSL